LGDTWRAALADVVIRHHDSRVTVRFEVTGDDDPYLHMRVENCLDSGYREEVRWPSLAVSSVKLTYFPGVAEARAWLAAGYAGYMMHEALELVTLGGDPTKRVFDPHAGPENDKGLRRGLPVILTPETLEAAMSIVR